MNNRIRCLVLPAAMTLLSLFAQSAFAQVDLRSIIKVEELGRSGRHTLKEVDVADRRSGKLIITLNAAALTALPDGEYSIRMFSSYKHSGAAAKPVAVENYYTKNPLATPGSGAGGSSSASGSGVSGAAAGSTAGGSGSSGTQAASPAGNQRIVADDATLFRYSDHPFKIRDHQFVSLVGELPPTRPPNSEIILAEQSFDSDDVLSLRIREINTSAEQLTYDITLGEFGLNNRIVDSFLLLKRRGVSKQDLADGEKEANFKPAPGVTFGFVYNARHNKFARILAPGIGYNVSFTDWNDPAFDVASGKFAKGTDANKIEVTTGPIVSFFNNTLHFTYGWNLNVKSDRSYWGVGFSFFKLSEKIAGLIKQ